MFFLLGDGNKVTVGAPAINGAQVGAKVVRHLKGDKVIVFKKKRRKGYRVKNGHRQHLSEILIESIVASGAKAAPAKAKAAPKKEAKPAAKAKTETKAPEKKAAAPKKAAPAGDLSKNTVAELKAMAKAKGITGYSSMKKADLIAALSK